TIAMHDEITGLEHDAVAVLVTLGHEILSAGEDVDVRLGVVVVARKATIGLAGDRRQSQGPAVAEWAVAAARAVGQRERRSKAAATAAGGDRHAHARRAREHVGGE